MINAEKGISNEILTQNLDLVLRVLPDNAFQRQQQSFADDLPVPMDRTSVRSSSAGSENRGIQAEDDNVITATSLSDARDETGASRDEVTYELLDISFSPRKQRLTFHRLLSV